MFSKARQKRPSAVGMSTVMSIDLPALAQVSEDVEPVRQMAIKPTLDDSGRRQTRRQVRQKTLTLPLPGLPGAVHMSQEFGDLPGRDGDHR